MTQQDGTAALLCRTLVSAAPATSAGEEEARLSRSDGSVREAVSVCYKL